MAELHPVDPSTNPHLQGRFAPVHDEVVADDLEVEGSLPDGLEGCYLRNGPNPRFTPLGSYTFPMEGDAMLHGIWFEHGRARYRNRWVVTNGMKAEMAAGHALYGGLLTPSFPDMDLLGDDPDPGWPFRLDPFINVVHHGGRWLALEEGSPPYEVDADLGTVGRYDFGGALPGGMCAHPKVDPSTGEMVLFRYDLEAPFLTWSTVAADGTVTRADTPLERIDRTYMVHDCAITPRYLVLPVAPVVIDLDAMGDPSGPPPIHWIEDQPTQVAVIDRGDGSVRWIDADPFFVWHYANAYEDGDEIVLDFPWWDRFVLGPEAHQGGFARARLDPEAATMRLDLLDHDPSEFARIDGRRLGQPHRYVVASRKSGRVADLPTGEFDQLVRHDMQTGERVTLDADGFFGEVTFVPRPGGSEELDGWWVAFTSSADATRSWFSIWDAETFSAEPVAKVHLPQRVPQGLHGDWFPAT